MPERHSQAMIIHQVKKEFNRVEAWRMTAFEAYWRALKTGLKTLRSSHRAFWRRRQVER